MGSTSRGGAVIEDCKWLEMNWDELEWMERVGMHLCRTWQIFLALFYYSVNGKENIDTTTVVCDSETFILSYLESSQGISIYFQSASTATPIAQRATKCIRFHYGCVALLSFGWWQQRRRWQYRLSMEIFFIQYWWVHFALIRCFSRNGRRVEARREIRFIRQVPVPEKSFLNQWR